MFHPALRASVCAALALASSLPALAAVPDVVRDAVATGDCSTVIARTEGLTDPGARLVRGRCQVILGEPAAAADTLAQVTEGVYGDVAARVRAQALLDLGRPEEALAATEGHTLPGAEGLRLRLPLRTLIAGDGGAGSDKSFLFLFIKFNYFIF